jgi:hypothetical protein
LGSRRAGAATSGLVVAKIRFGDGKEMMTWRDGTYELGRRIGKLLKSIVF